MLRPARLLERLTSPCGQLVPPTRPPVYGRACPSRGLPQPESAMTTRPNHPLPRQDLHLQACQRPKAAHKNLLFARPFVLSATRVRERWFLVSPNTGRSWQNVAETSTTRFCAVVDFSKADKTTSGKSLSKTARLALRWSGLYVLKLEDAVPQTPWDLSLYACSSKVG
jgi:hypothetical protein